MHTHMVIKDLIPASFISIISQLSIQASYHLAKLTTATSLKMNTTSNFCLFALAFLKGSIKKGTRC